MEKCFFAVRPLVLICAVSLLTGCATNSSQPNQGFLAIINPENTCRNYHSLFKSKTEKYSCKQEYENGEFYVGEHVDGLRHGTGLYKWPDGASFQGSWFRGNRDYGVFKYSDGYTYEGPFRDNQAHGNGKLIDPSGKVIRQGLFEFGKYVPDWELERRRQAEAAAETDRRNREQTAQIQRDIAERERQERERLEQVRRDAETRERLAREQAERERIAREGDGSSHDLLCKRYGMRPQTSQYAECRMQLDAHERQQAEQRRIYEQRVAEYERERERRRGEAMFLLGMGMLANSGRPAAQPMAPMPPPPAMQSFNLFIKGRPPINCMSNLNIIDCR